MGQSCCTDMGAACGADLKLECNAHNTCQPIRSDPGSVTYGSFCVDDSDCRVAGWTPSYYLRCVVDDTNKPIIPGNQYWRCGCNANASTTGNCGIHTDQQGMCIDGTTTFKPP